MDLVGPLQIAQGNCKFMVVAVGYFTKWMEAKPLANITSKWIEAKPLANITSSLVQKFFWQNVICRFGVPREMTMDNGKQFYSNGFRDFYASIGTKVKFASVYHPQSNGLWK